MSSKRREESAAFQALVREVGEREANRIYDTKAEYQKRMYEKRKASGEQKPAVCRSKGFFSKLADEYEKEGVTND